MIMKIFKKFNPNEDYLLRIQISMAVVLIAINFAFTRTVDRKVDNDLIICRLPIPDPGVMHIVPPPTFAKKKNAYSKVGSKVIIEELVTIMDTEVNVPEEEFDFDPNRTPKFSGKIKGEEKEDKLVFHIPDANAEFPGE